jgi:soluble lytic murein transglycosylase-like protein
MEPAGRIGEAASASGGRAARSVPSWVGLPSSRATPEQVKDAFETLLVAEILKPLEESLRASGLFPEGAAGDIYAQLWKQHLGGLIARQLDLFPGWQPGAEATAAAGSASTSQSTTSLTKTPRATVATRARAVPRASAPAEALAVATPVSRPSADSDAAKRAQLAGHPLASRLGPFEGAIREASRLANVGANWLRAIIIQESGGQPLAVSRRGAQGLMQLLPTTGSALGVRNPFDPLENISAGARYFTGLLSRFGDERLALAAYNAGPGRVAAYGGVPPFQETQAYVARVLALKEEFDQLLPGDGNPPRP